MKVWWVWLAVLLMGCLPQSYRPVVKPTETARSTMTATAAPTKTPTITPSPTPMVCIVSTGYKAGTVNVRSGPGMGYPVVTVVSEGTQLLITGQQINGWSQVKTPSHTGWFYTEKWCKK